MASSNKTARLHLNQWSLTDALRMEDFNRDNLNIDEAVKHMANAAYGSYTGDGRCGASAPIGFSLDFMPVLIVISGKGGSADSSQLVETTAVLMKNRSSAGYTVSIGGQAKNIGLVCSWDGKTVTFYSEAEGEYAAHEQLNASGETYNYVAIGL